MSAVAGRVLIIPKGVYVAGTTYNMLDLVKYNSKSFLAKRTNTNVTPVDGADWMELTDDGVQSFNGRTGTVLPDDGDYDISQISPLNGAAVGMVPVVKNVGTAQAPVYKFDMGYVSGGGIGTSNSIDQQTDAYIATVSSGFIVTTGSYLSIIFGINFTKPSSSALQLSIGGVAYEVKINGQSATAGKTYIKSGDAGIFVYDGIYFQLIGTSGGGHVIQDASGTAVAQEPTMQFTDSHVSDDSTNEKTVIENIKSVTEAQFKSATEDGLYDVDVEGAEIGEISEDYVEVTADGNTTWADLLKSVFNDAKFDISKVNKYSKLAYSTNGIKIYDLNLYFVNGTTSLAFSASSDTSYDYAEFNGSFGYFKTGGTDVSSNKPTQGATLTLYYGNDKAVVDLQTTANRCWYDDNNTVKQKIDTKADTSNIVSGSVSLVYQSAYYCSKDVTIPSGALLVANFLNGIGAFNKTSGIMITNLTTTSARITAYSSGGNYTSGDTVSANYIAVKS